MISLGKWVVGGFRWIVGRFFWKWRTDKELLRTAFHTRKWRYGGMEMFAPTNLPQGYVVYSDGFESRTMLLGHACDYASFDWRHPADPNGPEARVVIDRGDRKKP
jgi:hypothetical protein